MDFTNKKKYVQLYDFYQNLLTKKQQEYFSYYFFEDYSLSEIAEIKKVSRNAVYDSLLNIIKNMDDLEAKLHLCSKNEMREKIYNKFKNDDNIKFINELKKIDDLDFKNS